MKTSKSLVLFSQKSEYQDNLESLTLLLLSYCDNSMFRQLMLTSKGLLYACIIYLTRNDDVFMPKPFNWIKEVGGNFYGPECEHEREVLYHLFSMMPYNHHSPLSELIQLYLRHEGSLSDFLLAHIIQSYHSHDLLKMFNQLLKSVQRSAARKSRQGKMDEMKMLIDLRYHYELVEARMSLLELLKLQSACNLCAKHILLNSHVYDEFPVDLEYCIIKTRRMIENLQNEIDIKNSEISQISTTSLERASAIFAAILNGEIALSIYMDTCDKNDRYLTRLFYPIYKQLVSELAELDQNPQKITQHYGHSAYSKILFFSDHEHRIESTYALLCKKNIEMKQDKELDEIESCFRGEADWLNDLQLAYGYSSS